MVVCLGLNPIAGSILLTCVWFVGERKKKPEIPRENSIFNSHSFYSPHWFVWCVSLFVLLEIESVGIVWDHHYSDEALPNTKYENKITFFFFSKRRVWTCSDSTNHHIQSNPIPQVSKSHRNYHCKKVGMYVRTYGDFILWIVFSFPSQLSDHSPLWFRPGILE